MRIGKVISRRDTATPDSAVYDHLIVRRIERCRLKTSRSGSHTGWKQFGPPFHGRLKSPDVIEATGERETTEHHNVQVVAIGNERVMATRSGNGAL